MEAKNIQSKKANGQGWHRSTELCIDLKTILRSDRRAKLRKDYPGVLTRDGREHYTFTETLPEQAGKRNPHVFCGEFITVTRWADGSLHPNFKPTRIGGKGFNLTSYAWGVACELREALKGLIEENMSEVFRGRCFSCFSFS